MLKRFLHRVFRGHGRGGDPTLTHEAADLCAAADQALRERRHGDAAENYLRATRLGAASAALHGNLATALKALGRGAEALSHYRVAVELEPELPEAWYNLGLLYAESCELEAAEACYREALARRPGFREAHSSLLCLANYHEEWEPERVLAEHRAWEARHAPAHGASRHHPNAKLPERPIRIGYVSADLREHAMSCFVEPIFERHDAAAFSVVAYSNSRREDATSARLRRKVSRWRHIADMSDEDAAQQVRLDAIDILIDLSGHTEGNRLGVFALKPAPVQVSCLGYPNTTGLAAMDYRISDARADPPGKADRYYCERLLRLPVSLWCYRPPADLPEPSALPAIERGRPTFGSLNNVMKLSAQVLAAWAKLLRKVPEADLLLASAGGEVAQCRLRQQFAAHGVEPARLEILGRLAPREFRRLYARVDVALDPFPCNGGTTTCESLWMGLPVVTLAGTRFSGRAGASILAAAGLAEWIATDESSYLATAAALVADLARLSELRRGMRERLAASALADEAGYVRALESLYRQAWRRWCAGS